MILKLPYLIQLPPIDRQQTLYFRSTFFRCDTFDASWGSYLLIGRCIWLASVFLLDIHRIFIAPFSPGRTGLCIFNCCLQIKKSHVCRYAMISELWIRKNKLLLLYQLWDDGIYGHVLHNRLAVRHCASAFISRAIAFGFPSWYWIYWFLKFSQSSLFFRF